MKEQDKQLLRANQDLCALRAENAELRDENARLRAAAVDTPPAEGGVAQTAESRGTPPVTSPGASEEARVAAVEVAESRKTTW